MKRVIILFLLIGSFHLSAQNIHNSGFEDWTIGGFVQKPTGWSTSNEYTATVGTYTVHPDSNSFVGNYAVKIQTIDLGTPPVPYPGFVVNGQLVPTGSNDFQKLLYAGEPFPYKPFKLMGFYKFKSNAPIEDWAYAYVLLKKYDPNSNSIINIGVGSKTLLNPTSEYTYFEVPISYIIKDETPDSIVVAFYSTYPQSPISGGEFWVDKITFDYTGSIDEHQNSFHIYPNPVHDHLFIEQNTLEKNSFNIFDMYGRSIRSGYVHDQISKINMEKFNPGIYFIVLNSSKGIISSKFVKE